MGLQNIIIEMTQEFALVHKSEVDALIQTYLERVGQDLEAQRGGVVVFNHKKTNMTWLVEWAGGGQEFKNTCKRKRVENYPWMMDLFKNYRGFLCNPGFWDGMADSEERLFGKWDCPAVICQPIYQNELKGFCFWGREEPSTWGRNEELALKQVANIFGIGLKRRS